jgi:hypothetical protein
MISFASANLLINEISPLGIDAIEYYNTGALVFCILYGIYRSCGFKRKNFILSQKETESERMLQIHMTEHRELFYKRTG